MSVGKNSHNERGLRRLPTLPEPVESVRRDLHGRPPAELARRLAAPGVRVPIALIDGGEIEVLVAVTKVVDSGSICVGLWTVFRILLVLPVSDSFVFIGVILSKQIWVHRVSTPSIHHNKLTSLSLYLNCLKVHGLAAEVAWSGFFSSHTPAHVSL